MMKRLLVILSLVGVLGALLTGVVFAAPATPPAGDACPMWEEGRGGMMGRGGMGGWFGASEEVEKLLGMSADEIRAARLEGKSLAEIADGKGVSAEQLVGAILAAKQDVLDELVGAGKLTQEQADLMLDHMEQMVTQMIDRSETGTMRQHGRGMMGPGTGRGGRSMMRFSLAS